MAKPGSARHLMIESLKERIARDPLSRAFLQLAEEYRKLGRYREAVQVCLDGLERHPTYHTARISLGRTHVEAGDLAQAKRAFSEVLELQPENHLAGKLLAEVQKQTSDLSGAAETYRTILRYYPGDREVQGLLSAILGGGEAARAPVAAKAGVPGTPAQAVPPATPVPSPTLRSADPAVDFQVGDLDGAGLAVTELADATASPWAAAPVETVEEAVNRDDALQTNTLAELYLRQGLVDRAIEVYRSMLRVDPDNQRAARRLAELSPPAEEAPGAAPDAVNETTRRVPRSAGVPAPTVPARLEWSAPIAAPSAGAGAPRRDPRIGRLESWLQRVRSGSAGGATPR